MPATPSDGNVTLMGGTRLTREARREQLLDAAAQLGAASLDSVTMEGLAARAGVSKALPYKFFANRDEVLVALYDRELAVLEARIKAAVAGVEGFVPRLTATVESWLDGVASAGVLLGVLYTHPGLAGPVEERREESSRYLAESWGGAAAEEFGIDRRRAERLIEVAIAGSLALVGPWLRADPERRRELVDDFVGFVAGGILAVAMSPAG